MKLQQTVLNRIGIKLELFLVFDSKDKVGNIYISSYLSAMKVDLLQKNQIKSVLSLAKGCKILYEKQIIPYYLYLPIQDKKNFDIRKYFDRCFEYIQQCRQKTNILIHCKVGISRSVTILIAYLMFKFQLNLQQAYQMVKQANPQIKPNIGFIQVLKLYNKQLGRAEVQYNQKNNQFYLIKIQQQNNCKQNQLKYKINQKQIIKQQYEILTKQKLKIDSHIKQIKNMIQINSSRTRKMSQYLKEKIQIFQKKKQLLEVKC